MVSYYIYYTILYYTIYTHVSVVLYFFINAIPVLSEWLVADGLDKKSFRETLVSLCVSTIEFIGSIIKVSYYFNANSNGSSVGVGGSSDLFVLIPTEEALKQLALLLVQCISFPIFELAAAGITTVGIWGQRDFQASNADSTSSLLLFSKPVNFFLTNALLRRIMEPNGFAVTSQYLLYTDGGDDHTSRQSSNPKSKGKGGIDLPRMKELNQKRNVELSGLRISDACFNALIDLHTSDDPAYLDNFVRLNSLEKLSNRFQDFGKR